MAAQWVEQDSKAQQVFNEEPSLQLFVSEDSKSASRKSLPSHRSDEPPSDIALMSGVLTSPLPFYRTLSPFHIPMSKIFEVFSKSSSARSFQVIEQSSTLATAVHRDRLRFRDLLCCLSRDSCEVRKMTAVRLHIGVNEKKCVRTILIKGIYGSGPTVQGFINAFQTRMESVVKGTEEESSRAPSVQGRAYEHLNSEKMMHEEDGAFTIKNESASYYQFHKILSSEAYSLGSTIASFVSSFTQQYRNIEESSELLPQPVLPTQMDSVKLLIEETVEALFSHFNFGKAHTERMMHYCRPAVEKFLYAKLMPQLVAMYRCKMRTTDEGFAQKRKELQSLSPREILDLLEVKPKWRLGDLPTPYKEAIEMLSKLKEFNTPTEKLNCLLSAVAAMKTAVVDYWHAKEELDAMDDQLPVLIFIVVCSAVESPAAEVRLLQDYTRQSNGFDNELQLLTNFEVSVRYIAQEWQLPH